ncbi:hypothetical protein ACG7TL_007233 [Trametes sanguinea]
MGAQQKLAKVPPYVFPTNLREVRYQGDPLTKIDTLIALLKYHHRKFCAQLAQFDENTLVEPPYNENLPQIKPDTVDKALVYLSFLSSNFIVMKALEKAGITYLVENNSKMTAPACHQAGTVDAPHKLPPAVFAPCTHTYATSATPFHSREGPS